MKYSINYDGLNLPEEMYALIIKCLTNINLENYTKLYKLSYDINAKIQDLIALTKEYDFKCSYLTKTMNFIIKYRDNNTNRFYQIEIKTNETKNDVVDLFGSVLENESDTLISFVMIEN